MERLVKILFDKFKNRENVIDKAGFKKLMFILSKQIPELQNITEMEIEANFAFISNNSTIDEKKFLAWWNSGNKYSLLMGEKAKLLVKAYVFYKKYTHDKNELNKKNFLKLVEDFDILATKKEFDIIDVNEDGVIDFEEFCKWLDWF